MPKRPPKLSIVVPAPEAPTPVNESAADTTGQPFETTDPANQNPPSTTQAAVVLFRAALRDLRQLWVSLQPHFISAGTAARNAVTSLIERAHSIRSGKAPVTAEGQNSAPDSEQDNPDAVPRSRLSRKKLAIGAAGLLVTFFVTVVGIMIWALHDVPLDRIAAGQMGSQVIVLTTVDGSPLIQQGPYQEIPAGLDEYPDHVVEAVIAIEDRRFYDHWGVDVWGIGRALSRNIFAGEVREGGSTITQQLLKILYLEPDRTVRRKVQEVFLSLWLERSQSKDEILALYLNNIYLGAGATGMPAAARVYFDKGVSELSLAEGALLAGLIASPSALNPLGNLEGALDRTGVVLNAMLASGYLSEDELLEAQLHSAQLRPRRPDLGTGTWFADWAMAEAQDIAGQFSGSAIVTTTLSPDLQSVAEQSVAAILAEHAAGSGASQAAMVVLSPEGGVLAMVGGVDYNESQFNRALAPRQPGSTFKVFPYYAALKLGAQPDTQLDDSPIEIDGWSPENIDGEFSGRVTLAESFARSLNVATVRMGMEIGLPAVVEAARELGIDAPLQETPSMLLGASEVTLLDLTGAFASLRAGAAPIQPYAIETFQAPRGQPFTIRSGSSALTDLSQVHTNMLGLLQLVVERGTGQAARIGRFAAGKTGTSQDYRDAWFIGFDENYTVGVWVGNDDNSPMEEVTGGKLPALIWQHFMTSAVSAEGTSDGSIVRPAAGASSSAEAPPLCNIQVCSQSYRSFRASDCTFQPYSGPRRICEK